jgi:putative transposase
MTHERKSNRLKGFDYNQAGPYFVTLVTHGRAALFGTIVDNRMQFNPFGQIVTAAWYWLGEQYPYLELIESVVMPDHFHGILTIGDEPNQNRRDASRRIPTRNKIKPLGQLIGAFKTVSAKRINLLRDTPGTPVWQPDFYERIIRNEAELSRIYQYIQLNPARSQDGEEEEINPIS